MRAALGIRTLDLDGNGFKAGPEERDAIPDTDQGARLARILARGKQGCWRRLAHPTRDVVEAVEALGAAAPHMSEATELAARHARGRSAMGLPTKLPHVQARILTFEA